MYLALRQVHQCDAKKRDSHIVAHKLQLICETMDFKYYLLICKDCDDLAKKKEKSNVIILIFFPH